jgi:plasmid maintenance system antidote protein VapI
MDLLGLNVKQISMIVTANRVFTVDVLIELTVIPVTAILDLLGLNVKQISMIVTASHVFTEAVQME